MFEAASMLLCGVAVLLCFTVAYYVSLCIASTSCYDFLCLTVFTCLTVLQLQAARHCELSAAILDQTDALIH